MVAFIQKAHGCIFLYDAIEAQEAQLAISDSDQLPTFVVDPSITTRVTGAVTRLIPIPLEWAPMFLDGPTFGMAFRRMFDLLDSQRGGPKQTPPHSGNDGDGMLRCRRV